jgi:hypothetical protein
MEQCLSMLELQTVFLIFGLLTLMAMVVLPVLFGAPWHPLLPRTIRRILRFAEVRPGEIFCDLGCGEGRVLITAAKEFSAHAIGVEIDPLKFVLPACWLDLIELVPGWILFGEIYLILTQVPQMFSVFT